MPDDPAGSLGLRISFFPDRVALTHAVAALADESCARVSLSLPLRANLNAVENIALIQLYRKQADMQGAGDRALELLQRLGASALGLKREPDMTMSERFIVLLARALVLQRSRLVIDQPGALLYDEPYPALLRTLHQKAGTETAWEVYDYTWNRVLYE